MDLIKSIKPDLILGFSDVQHEVARQLIKDGFNVFVSNQRSVEEVLMLIRQTGALEGRQTAAEELTVKLRNRLDEVGRSAKQLPKRPRVYFEEWYGPLISGIRWVSELIGIAGGEDCFSELSLSHSAKGRVVQPEAVVEAVPDIILVSWCGKRFIPSKIYSRPGWESIPAIANRQVFEIDPAIILQPGPAALTDGLDTISGIIKRWVQLQQR